MENRYSCVIIEDDPAFLMMVAIAVRKLENIKIVATFEKAFEAMSFLQKESPDILITDINVEGHKGPEIVNMCEVYPQVIIISSHPETIMEDYPIRYTSYIQKPLAKLSQIADAIELCIRELE
jgi:two-component system LytT family response regulator